LPDESSTREWFRLWNSVAVAAFLLLTLAFGLDSCASNNPNSGRILISIAVTPETANAQNFANGQVTFTATGTFNLSPLSAVLTFAAPYSGEFSVNNPANSTIANVVGTGTGTVTVQCATGASGTVDVIAAASANDGFSTIISGSGILTCP
jgi:hypothetical protein